MVLFTAEKQGKAACEHVTSSTHRAKHIYCFALLWKPFQEHVIDGKQVNFNIINLKKERMACFLTQDCDRSSPSRLC